MYTQACTKSYYIYYTSVIVRVMLLTPPMILRTENFHASAQMIMMILFISVQICEIALKEKLCVISLRILIIVCGVTDSLGYMSSNICFYRNLVITQENTNNINSRWQIFEIFYSGSFFA